MDETIPALRGERLSLRQMTEADLPAVQRWRSDREVTRFWITRQAPSTGELLDWLDENRRSGSWTWLINDVSDNPIGYLDVFSISRKHRRCELSLMIGERSAWGQGYGREALSTVLSYLFAAREAGGADMHKVSLSVFAENHAARRVYLACGFREDGVLRDDMRLDGRWHDQILMSVLSDEFAGG